MKDRKIDRTIASITKIYKNDPTLMGSMKKLSENSQNLMQSNNILRGRLRSVAEALSRADSVQKRKKIIQELEEIHHLYRCIDQYFIEILEGTLKTITKNATALATQVGKDAVTHNALEAKHNPARRAKNMLWDEWQRNSDKYLGKTECAKKNYERIIKETKAKLSESTFIRALMCSKRPEM